jgi:hypothetical protein
LAAILSEIDLLHEVVGTMPGIGGFTVTTLPNHSPSPFERVCQVQFDFSIWRIDPKTSILRLTIIDELENGRLFVHGESAMELEASIPSESNTACRKTSVVLFIIDDFLFSGVYAFDCMIEKKRNAQFAEVWTFFDVDFFPNKKEGAVQKMFKSIKAFKKFAEDTFSVLIAKQAEKMVQAAMDIDSKSHAIERNVPSKIMLYQYLESRCQQSGH